ncbi:MAG: hypothetical protein K0B15_10260 [Lentimicrobium sp.]|nr:hypothetical protein [Lentimicrobium sp.]
MSVLIFSSCKSSSKIQKEELPGFVTGPNVIIYKTTRDYSKHVPVTLSDDKKTLVSYPAPGDVFFNGDLAYPVKLENGFLLDRRGIGKNSAFLQWTYYEYSRLEKTPVATELLKMVLDSDPFEVIYDCGKASKFSDPEVELNAKIRTGNLSDFKRIK